MRKIFLAFIVPIFMLNSCSTDDPNFFDIDSVNTEIKQAIGIDILVILTKTEKKRKLNPNYYKEEIDRMAHGENLSMFQDYGLKIRKDNGDSIRKDQVEEYLETMLNSLKNGLILKGCDSIAKENSSCDWKNKIIEWVESEDSESRYIRYQPLAEDFYNLYQKDFFNTQEFNYIVCLLYVLVSVDSIDNEPPPNF